MSNTIEVEKVYDELGLIRQELAEVKAQLAEIVEVNKREQWVQHPHIMRRTDMHRGEPTIQGSSITVRTIIERTKVGDTPEEIVEAYPVLTLAQVHAALGYYYEHPGEIENYIQENREALWRTREHGSS
ncbi:MAG: DUF433 domain-containing protein [Anaerolineae bacterium]|nr:DUF433 domain-containing protein [Anaerolineae bacterium]